ncbi:potassium channel family protein [Lutimaribacter marinistellae]|uniref:Potassium channel family protein n=1 Tax=Lutimaribacter marinistellae TaxID=1820329 RepID=A0ABV7TLD2_9RHOB
MPTPSSRAETLSDANSGARWGGLLSLLIVAILVVPLFGSTVVTELSSLALFQVAVIGALAHAAAPGRHRVFFFGISAAWFVLITISTAVDALFGPAMLLSAILLIAALWATFANLVDARAGNIDNLMGAVFGYLLLAVAWAILFMQMERLHPGSFTIEENADLSSTMIYFSLVTLTTLGYGDILPQTRLAEIAAGLEAVVGVLYIAVMVGSIVGTYKRDDTR